MADKSNCTANGVAPYFGTIGKTADNPILVYTEFGDTTINLPSSLHPNCGASYGTGVFVNDSDLYASDSSITFAAALGDGLLDVKVKYEFTYYNPSEAYQAAEQILPADHTIYFLRAIFVNNNNLSFKVR